MRTPFMCTSRVVEERRHALADAEQLLHHRRLGDAIVDVEQHRGDGHDEDRQARHRTDVATGAAHRKLLMKSTSGVSTLRSSVGTTSLQVMVVDAPTVALQRALLILSVL